VPDAVLQLSLNPEQNAAVTARAATVLIAAGAGSGKTRVLTSRYLDLLVHEHYSLDQILTLTFTRKAAQEMRKRIARELEGLGRWEERRRLMRAPIGTIHSFCERLVREYALQAGIDPAFRVLDDAEARTLQDKALDRVLTQLWEAPASDTREMIVRLLLEYPPRELRSALLGTYRALRTRGQALDTLALAPQSDFAVAGQRLLDAVDALLALPGTVHWQTRLAEVRSARTALLPLLVATGEGFTWDRYEDARSVLAQLTPDGGPKTTAKGARDAIRHAGEAWLAASLEWVIAPHLHAFLLVLRQFSLTYEAEKQARSLVDFEDLLLTARDLLDETEGNAAQRYRRQFRQVMVDEFQDTNLLQVQLLTRLREGGALFCVGDAQQSIYRFLGSDLRVFAEQVARVHAAGSDGQLLTMATNYRTRPELLEPINSLFRRLWTAERTEASLTFMPLRAGRNGPAKAIPSVEVALWPPEQGSTAMLRDREANWLARRILQLVGCLDAPPLTVADPTAPSGRPARFGDVLVLFRASTDLPLYEDALRHAGIPVLVVSGRGFYESREVQDLIYLLRALENPHDDFALATVMRSPLVALSDDTLFWLSREWREAGDTLMPMAPEERCAPGRLWRAIPHVAALPTLAEAERQSLQEFRTLIDELHRKMGTGQPLELLDELLARTRWGACLLAGEGGEQRLANVNKLRQIAADFQARGIFDLADFRRYLTELAIHAPRETAAPIESDGGDGVRLMTIHAAKGLEAPIVCVADCGRALTSFPGAFFFTVEGLVGKAPTPEGDWLPTANYARAVAYQRQEEQAEVERLLYVALTRAQEHLLLSGINRDETPGSFAHLLTHGWQLPPPGAEDQLVSLSGEVTSAIRVWATVSLDTLPHVAPPASPPTLWENYAEALLGGAPLPLVTSAASVEHYRQLLAEMQTLSPRRQNRPLRVGVNRLLTYLTCPRQFWLRYILHPAEEAPRTGLPPMGEGTDAAERWGADDQTAFGTTLHAVLQRVDFSIPLARQVQPILTALAQANLLSNALELVPAVSSCVAQLSSLACYSQLRSAKTLQREVPFVLFAHGLYIPGVLDVLGESDGHWWLLDYKTGQPTANHWRQVALYTLGVQACLGVTPARVSLVYLSPTGVPCQKDELQVAMLLDQAEDYVQRAAVGLRYEFTGVPAPGFVPSPGHACLSCPVHAACPSCMDRRRTQVTELPHAHF
jgi:ATP-dependent helicase/nuclease subunit A